MELARSNFEEKNSCLQALEAFKEQNKTASTLALENLISVALAGGNIFECLMSACRVCSLQQMTEALFEVGGQYRRNI